MDLSVCIVNWNVKDMLHKCLESVYRYTQGIDLEVFVVDNNSTDGSLEMVRKFFPQTVLIANEKNCGFSAANNQVLRRAQGRYALLLNPDTELIDNSLKALVDFMDSHLTINASAPQLRYPDGSLQPSCRHFPSLLTDFFESLSLDVLLPKSPLFNRYRMGQWDHAQMRSIDQPYGACLIFRKEDLIKLDFMDESFFMYYDEVDLCYRLKKAGGRIYYLPQIKVIHAANQSSKQIPEACDEWKSRSRVRFFIKHYGRGVLAGLFLNLVLRWILVYGVFSITSILFVRPRDKYYFKKSVQCLWRLYVDACKPSFHNKKTSV